MAQEKLHLEPQLIVLAGLPLSGKTRIGEKIGDSTDVAFFDIDQTRQEISPGKDWLGPEKEREVMLKSYERNHEKARGAVEAGKAAVLVATYSRDVYQEMAQALARSLGVALHYFLVHIPLTAVEERIKRRIAEGSDSNITDLSSYREILDRYNPPPDAVTIDGTVAPEKNAEFIVTQVTDTTIRF